MGLSHRSIRQLKGLVWLGTAGLGGLAGLNFYETFKALQAGKFEYSTQTQFTQYVEVDSTDFPPPPEAKSWAYFKPIYEARINGVEYVEPVVVDDRDPVPLEPTLVPLDSIITVRMLILTDEKQRQGLVTVEYKDIDPKDLFSRDQIVLGVGDQLAVPYLDPPYNGILKAVERDAVFFHWGEGEVRLAFEQASEVASATEVGSKNDPDLTDDEERWRKEDPQETKSLGNDAWLLGRDDRDSMSKNADLWMRDAGLSEETGPDGKRKVVLKNVRTGGIPYSRYGARSGDELISINGNPVTSRQAAIRWAQENPNLPKYVVVFNRLGRPITKTIIVPQD